MTTPRRMPNTGSVEDARTRGSIIPLRPHRLRNVPSDRSAFKTAQFKPARFKTAQDSLPSSTPDELEPTPEQLSLFEEDLTR
jgi:hypothetical protein